MQLQKSFLYHVEIIEIFDCAFTMSNREHFDSVRSIRFILSEIGIIYFKYISRIEGYYMMRLLYASLDGTVNRETWPELRKYEL